MIRAAILCRVSTEGQRDNTSLPEQRRILTEICDRQGWAWEAFDEVESGGAGLANRPVLAALMGRIAAGEFERLVVLVPDRLSRAGVGELEQIAAALAKVGARLVTTSGEIDPADPDQGFMLDVQAVIAKREREVTRRRTISGRDARVREGGFGGHPVPFGWRRVYATDGSSHFEIDPGPAALVREVFERYAAGVEGQARIADALGLQQTRVKYLLANPRYAGLEHWRRLSYRDYDRPAITVQSQAFPAIVSVELWERCQAVKDRKRNKGSGTRGPGKWPLSGILRCDRCGSPCYYWGDGRGEGLRYYACRDRACRPKTYWRTEEAHAAVLDALPSMLVHLADAAAELPEGDGRANALRARLAELAAEEDKLWREHLAGMPGDRYRRLAAAQDEARRQIEAQLAEIERQERQARAVPTGGDDMAAIIGRADRLDRDGLRLLFAGLLDRVTLAAEGGEVRRAGRLYRLPVVSAATLVDGRSWVTPK